MRDQYALQTNQKQMGYTKTPVGIIGQGFVGTAVRVGLDNEFNVMTYDKYETNKTTHQPAEILRKCEVVFVCVPTPMDLETGECHTGIVESVVAELDALATLLHDAGELNHPITLVVKSTVPPGTTKFLNDHRSEYVNVTFNPEFLTEANAIQDFMNQDRIILGGEPAALEPVVDVFQTAFPGVPIQTTDSTTAEMVKYTTNTFLSVKVSFANEIYDLCKASHVDYSKMIELAKLDKRLGGSHWMVPGPDGDRGFGGHCFPKDLTALRYVASQFEVQTPVLDGANETNNRVRANRDWEEQEGRAVINKLQVK
jgi:UDPglucose 6-dehydrogenase